MLYSVEIDMKLIAIEPALAGSRPPSQSGPGALVVHFHSDTMAYARR